MGKNFTLRFFIDASGRAAMMLLTLLLARVFDVPTFGRLAFALSFANWLYFLTEAGLHTLFLREMAHAPEKAEHGGYDRNRVWRDFFGLKLALAALTAVAGLLLAPALWPWDNPAIPMAVVFWMLGNSLVDFFNQTCNAVGRVSTSGWVTGGHRLLCVAAVVAAAALKKELWFVSAAFGAGSLAGCFLAYQTLRRRMDFVVWPAWDMPAWAGWLKASFPLACAGLFSSTYQKVGLFLLPWLGFSAGIGYYGAAQRFFEAACLVPVAFASLALPRLSRTHKHESENLPREVRSLGLASLLLSGGWLLFGEIFAPQIVRVIFGRAYGPAVPLLRILVAANALLFFTTFLSSLMVVLNRLKRQAVNEAVGLTAGALLTIFLLMKNGPAGAAWALVITESIVLALTVHALLTHRDRILVSRPSAAVAQGIPRKESSRGLRIGVDARPLCLTEGGGIPVYVRGMLTALAEVDQENEYVLYAHKDLAWTPPPPLRWVKRAGGGALGGTVWMETVLPLWLRQDKVDLFWGTQHVLPLAAPGALPMALSMMDMAYRRVPETMSCYNRQVCRFLIPPSVRRAGVLLPISHSTEGDIKALLPGADTKNYRVASPAAADIYKPVPREQARAELKPLLGEAADGPYFLTVGSLEPRKNLAATLKAFARLRAKHPHRLLLAGPAGWKMRDFLKINVPPALRDRVQLLGFFPREKMPALYGAADVFLFPSLYEGFGIPVLEAMACGCPVVTANVSSLPEIAGEAALTVAPADDAALAENIERLLTDGALREQMVQRGFAQARRYRWTASARTLIEAFRSLT